MTQKNEFDRAVKRCLKHEDFEGANLVRMCEAFGAPCPHTEWDEVEA